MVFIIKPWNTHTHIQHTVKDVSQELRREKQVERDGCQTEENAVVQGLSIMMKLFSVIGNKDNYKCCCTALRNATTFVLEHTCEHMMQASTLLLSSVNCNPCVQ